MIISSSPTHDLMENMKSDFDLHIQKSFSFTAFSKFKDSSLEFFSDDDDINDNKTYKNDDTNSYIEISLDHSHNHNHNNLNNNDNNSHLRISFSSSFPSIPEARPEASRAGPAPALSGATTTLRSNSTGAFNPLVHTLLFSLETRDNHRFSPMITSVTPGFDDCDRDPSTPMKLSNINRENIHSHRKAPNNNNTTGNNRNGIINKLLMIKVRATKIKKLISSLFTKSKGQVNVCNSNKVQNDISHLNKRQKRQQKHCYDNVCHVNDTKNLKPLEVNFGSVRGVLEAVNVTKNNNINNNYYGRVNNRRKTSSCPNSMKSSPIHQGFGGADCNNNGTFFGGENSILAAIAHCKSSLGQSTDFRF